MNVRLAVLLFFVCISTVLFAQNINLFLVPEGVETYMENTDYNANDHLNLLDIKGGVEESEDEENAEEKKALHWENVGVEIETIVSPRNMHLKVPLSYSFKNYAVNVSIPFYFKREMNYASGKKSVSGFGDAVVKGSYRLVRRSIANEFQISAKLPTGDENKTVDGFLVPLGTGTTDFIFANYFSYFAAKYQITNQLSYRLNTGYERIAEILYPDDTTEIIHYNITNGNTFILNSSYTYFVGNRMAIIAGLVMMSNGEGSYDRISKDNPDDAEKGLSARQDFTFFDIYPAICYTVFNIDLTLSVNIPLVTERNTANNEEDRGIEYLFRLSRKMF